MNEDFLNYIWKFQLIEQNIFCIDGTPLQIIQPGERNLNSGPDFFNARIRIAETIWAGNVEIHVNSSDWIKHGHYLDPVYDNIILHVVFNHDQEIVRQNKQPIPTLELKRKFNKSVFDKYSAFLLSKKWIPCQDLIGLVNYFDLHIFFDALMAERLEQKAGIINQELLQTKQDFQEVFYRKLARNFGFKVNADAFELLAKSLPLKIIFKHKDNLLQIEALLFGQAGLLEGTITDNYPNLLKTEYQFLSDKYALKCIDHKIWKFMRLRPANFPTIRIAQFANLLNVSSALLTRILEMKNLQDVVNLFRVETSEYWRTHYQFDIATERKNRLVGSASINLIIINTIVPFLFVYGKNKADESLREKALLWLEQIRAEYNQIIRHFKELNIKPQNAMQSQALIQLKTNYCDSKRCLECRIGHVLLAGN